MAVNKEQSFKKILIDDKPYFVQFNQNNEGDISLQLTNGNHMLLGKLPQKDIMQMAKGLDMTTKKLENLLAQCLASKVVQDFEYQLTESDETSSKLVLKQVVDGGFKFQLGSVPLKRSENSSQRLVSMLDHLTSELAKYKKEVEKVRNINNTISQEQEHMTQRLKEHMEAHVNMEQELYTKFSMVLNSKKAKIRELKKTIESGGGSSAKSSNIPQKDAKRRLVESDEDMETDEEKQTIKDHNKKKKLSSTDEEADEEDRTTQEKERVDEKDTAKEGENIRLDDSIGGDDDDMPRRSRKRMRATKPKTPVSSVLPRTTSLPRPKSAQKSSSATGSSQRSQRSSRNTSSEVSVDELLDNL